VATAEGELASAAIVGVGFWFFANPRLAFGVAEEGADLCG
jgi:hypothetical protein